MPMRQDLCSKVQQTGETSTSDAA